jgi:hypothetical protein
MPEDRRGTHLAVDDAAHARVGPTALTVLAIAALA